MTPLPFPSSSLQTTLRVWTVMFGACLDSGLRCIQYRIKMLVTASHENGWDAVGPPCIMACAHPGPAKQDTPDWGDCRERQLQTTSFSRAAKRGCFKRGVSRSGLVLPFLSFFVLFGTFPIFLGFSRFARGWSGDFPDWSFSSFSAY